MAMLPLLKWLKRCRRINVPLLIAVVVAVVNLPLLYRLNWNPVTHLSSSLAADIVSSTSLSRNSGTRFSNSHPTDVIRVTPLPPPLPRRLIGRMLFDSGRLGNEMFVYASLLGIADRNKMIAVYGGKQLRKWFTINAEKSAESEDNWQATVVRERSAYVIEPHFGQLASTYNGDVIINGYFQSWRYFDEVEDLVRQELQFNREVRNFASTFLRTNTRSASTTFTCISPCATNRM